MGDWDCCRHVARHKRWWILSSAVCGLVAPGVADAQEIATYEYDSLGRLTEVRDTNGTLSRFEFDPAGRVSVEMADANPSVFGIDDVTLDEGSAFVFVTRQFLHRCCGTTGRAKRSVRALGLSRLPAAACLV